MAQLKQYPGMYKVKYASPVADSQDVELAQNLISYSSTLTQLFGQAGQNMVNSQEFAKKLAELMKIPGAVRAKTDQLDQVQGLLMAALQGQAGQPTAVPVDPADPSQEQGLSLEDILGGGNTVAA
jgi:hypothetical protein